MGDDLFQLNGWEPELNSNPNDLRDTSTPELMANSLSKLALGHAFPPPEEAMTKLLKSEYHLKFKNSCWRVKSLGRR